MGVMNTVVVTTLMEVVIGVEKNPCEETTKSQPERSSVVDRLICNKHTREKQLLDNSRSLKRPIIGEVTAALEELLEK